VIKYLFEIIKSLFSVSASLHYALELNRPVHALFVLEVPVAAAVPLFRKGFVPSFQEALPCGVFLIWIEHLNVIAFRSLVVLGFTTFDWLRFGYSCSGSGPRARCFHNHLILRFVRLGARLFLALNSRS